MKKLLFSMIVFTISMITYSQTHTSLKAVSEKLGDYRDFRSYCRFSFSRPFSESLTVGVNIFVKRVPDDTLCGSFYYFITDPEDSLFFGDYSGYVNGTVFSSYKGKFKYTSIQEDPVEFTERKIQGGIVTPKHKSHVLYQVLPDQMAKTMRDILADSNYKISQKRDSLVSQDTCIRYTATKTQETVNDFNGDTLDYQSRIEFCFYKTSLYPAYFKKEIISQLLNTMNAAVFIEPQLNTGVKLSFFDEKNLFPEDWKLSNKADKIPVSYPLLGSKAPEWELPVLGEDRLLSNEELIGSYILLEFTATWCVHCFRAAQIMNKLEECFSENEKIAFVSIFSSALDNKMAIEKFVNKFKVESTVLYSAAEVEKQYQLHGYPKFLLINPEGIITKYYGGFSEVLEDSIKIELNKVQW